MFVKREQFLRNVKRISVMYTRYDIFSETLSFIEEKQSFFSENHWLKKFDWFWFD